MTSAVRAEPRADVAPGHAAVARTLLCNLRVVMPTTPLVVIGASAGGVDPLRTLVSGFFADLPAAVCIVLHVPPHSPSELAAVPRVVCKLPVTAAEDREPILAERVYSASADRHLMVDGTMLRLTRGPKESRVRPSVDVLFRSAAVAYGKCVVGLVCR